MKIALHVGSENAGSKAGQTTVPEKEILAAKGGDWNAKSHLARTFLPLLTSLAQKRTSDTGEINRYIEAGKQGLFKAIKKYKSSVGAENFQLFALDYIESGMDSRAGGKKGLLSRLFGKK